MNTEATRGVTDPALQALLSDHWERTMARSPTWATSLGDHRYDDQLGDYSPEAEVADAAANAAFLARARAIPAAGLSPADQLTLALFVDELEQARASEICHSSWWGLSARSNPLSVSSDLAELQPLDTLAQARSLVARVRQVPEMTRQWERTLRLGIEHGYTPSAASTRLVLEQLRAELAKPDADWALGALLADDHAGWPTADREGFRTDLARGIAGVRAALAAFATFLEADLLPVARPDDKEGIVALPDGRACYAARIRAETSLPLTADEVHARGLAELDRIHAEMRGVGQRLWGIDDRARLFARLRDDPALRFTSADEVVAAAEDNLARARAALPGQLTRLPKADCVVEPIPDYLAPYTYIAYYNPAVPDGSRAGEYRVNTYQPETRRRFEAAVLAFHESIPGHHLQIALAQELPDLPAFRRYGGWTAFVEGWALYGERVALEDGLYRDDLDLLGMYAFDTWRASRLVVDTGIHDRGWSREQAVRFMLDNTPLAENNIRNEVDRYITWPGQALAYKIGQQEILALRAGAEAALGDRFDRRRFHDVLLGAGAVSLPVLRQRVEAWVAGGGA